MGESPEHHEIMAELAEGARREKLPSLYRRPPNDEIIAALKFTAGLKAPAARRLRCAEQSLHTWIKADLELQQALDIIKSGVVDSAVGTIITIMHEKGHRKQLEAAVWLAERIDKTRGYGPSVHMTGDVNSTVTVEHRMVGVNERDFFPERLTMEEMDRYVDLRSRAPGGDLTPDETRELKRLTQKASAPMLETQPMRDITPVSLELQAIEVEPSPDAESPT